MINLDCDSIDSKKFVDIIERGNEKTEKKKNGITEMSADVMLWCITIKLQHLVLEVAIS